MQRLCAGACLLCRRSASGQSATRGVLNSRLTSSFNASSPAFSTTTARHYLPEGFRDWREVFKSSSEAFGPPEQGSHLSPPQAATTSSSTNSRTDAATAAHNASEVENFGETVPMPDSMTTWDRLRAWIDAQEAYERENNKPAPLSQQELLAIETLIPTKVPDRDWVSALNERIQRNRIKIPSFEDERAPPDGLGGWRVICTVENEGSFPRVHFGFEEGEEPPAFKTKKIAKQFAAEQACKYLDMTLSQKRHRVNGNSNEIHKGDLVGQPEDDNVPPVAPEHDTVSTNPARKRVKGNDASSLSGPSQVTTPGAAVTSPSVFQAIALRANDLGMQQPLICVEPDEELREGFFKGSAVFKQGTRVPYGIGDVSGVLGKAECKSQVAQKVLGWMEQELLERDALARRLIQSHVS